MTSCQYNFAIIFYKGLPAMDFNGLSDPYVKAHLLPGASKVRFVCRQYILQCSIFVYFLLL